MNETPKIRKQKISKLLYVPVVGVEVDVIADVNGCIVVVGNKRSSQVCLLQASV